MSLATDGADQPTLYKRIRADIENRILTGEWPPGHRIPFEHELVARYGCSRMTVNKALSELAQADLIERRRRAPDRSSAGRSISPRCSRSPTSAPRSPRSAALTATS
ncbi:DNA-binding FadR family transcriptional regulator [Bradyrhizobium japonicum]